MGPTVVRSFGQHLRIPKNAPYWPNKTKQNKTNDLGSFAACQARKPCGLFSACWASMLGSAPGLNFRAPSGWRASASMPALFRLACCCISVHLLWAVLHPTKHTHHSCFTATFSKGVFMTCQPPGSIFPAPAPAPAPPPQSKMDGWTNGQTDGPTGRRTDGPMDRWTDGCTDRLTDTWTLAWMHGHMDTQTD